MLLQELFVVKSAVWMLSVCVDRGSELDSVGGFVGLILGHK